MVQALKGHTLVLAKRDTVKTKLNVSLNSSVIVMVTGVSGGDFGDNQAAALNSC